MNESLPSNGPRHVVVTTTKSIGIQILLILFLGPLGLFYSTIKGALITMLGVPTVFAIIGPALGGAMASAGHATDPSGGIVMGLIGSFALMIPTLWIVSFIWGVIAVKSYNAGLMRTVAA